MTGTAPQPQSLFADSDRITDLAELAALYGAPSANSMLKEAVALTPEYRALIEASPFAILATAGPAGLDCSPRGDAPGFIAVADEHTLLIPDRRGNNRLDSLKNILSDPRIALIFLIPGIGETLRVNGRAAIVTTPSLLARFVIDGKAPQSVVVVSVEAVYFQCAKALMRSHLWDPERHVARQDLPSPGQMLKGASRQALDVAAIDAAYPQRLRETLY